MEITLLIMENHGIVFLNFCGNPEDESLLRSGLPGLNQYYLKQGLMRLAQGHNAVTPVGAEPTSPVLGYRR